LLNADLEIGLRRWDESRYAVELRYRPPVDAVDLTPIHGLTRFDLDIPRGADLEECGPLLSRALFADGNVQKHFGKIRAAAQTTNATLRIRLWIGPSAPELHGLKWELLRDPDSGDRLLTNQTIWFSRYLSSPDGRRVQLRPGPPAVADHSATRPSRPNTAARNRPARPPIPSATGRSGLLCPDRVV
jgi:hypothetical protein